MTGVEKTSEDHHQHGKCIQCSEPPDDLVMYQRRLAARASCVSNSTRGLEKQSINQSKMPVSFGYSSDRRNNKENQNRKMSALSAVNPTVNDHYSYRKDGTPQENQNGAFVDQKETVYSQFYKSSRYSDESDQQATFHRHDKTTPEEQQIYFSRSKKPSLAVPTLSDKKMVSRSSQNQVPAEYCHILSTGDQQFSSAKLHPLHTKCHKFSCDGFTEANNMVDDSETALRCSSENYSRKHRINSAIQCNKGVKFEPDIFEMDNSHFPISKKQTSGSSSDESYSERHVQQEYQSSFNFVNQPNNDLSKVSNLSESMHLQNGIPSDRSGYNFSTEASETSAVFAHGVLKDNGSSLQEICREKIPNHTVNRPSKLQFRVSTNPISFCSSGSRCRNALSQQKTNEDAAHFSLMTYQPNIGPASPNSSDTEGSVHSSWQRSKIYSPLQNSADSESNHEQSSASSEDSTTISTQLGRDSTGTSERTQRSDESIQRETSLSRTTKYRLSDTLESFSSNSSYSGHENGSSEKELRARCIAPACCNQGVRVYNKLCHSCYQHLDSKNTAHDSDSLNSSSLFAVDSKLCKAPHCSSLGSKGMKGLCVSCCDTLKRFVHAQNNTKVQGITSDPNQVRPHFRQDPNMPWNIFYRTPVKHK